MGHKTHPLGFRLGITQQHKSEWYTSLREYANYVKEDFLIRKVIWDHLKQEKIRPTGVTKIIIRRTNAAKRIEVEIFSALPGLLVGKVGSGLEKMYQTFAKNFPTKKIRINILEVKDTARHAELIAESIVQQLENRIPFRRAMKTTLKVMPSDIQGIKIQIAGRLNGAEIARTEWAREGRVPLQTMRADIDYAYQTAYTIYGILGIKVWLFKGDKVLDA